MKQINVAVIAACTFLLAGCEGWQGLKNAGQAALIVEDTGIMVGTSPLDGSVGATVGQKKLEAYYNSNTYESSDGSVTKLSSSYGGVTEDARSSMGWRGAQVEAGNNGSAIGGGSGYATGAAAFLRACQDGAISNDGQGNTGQFCMDAFRENTK